MEPAPSPCGIAHRQSHTIFFENEKPKRATTVRAVLNIVTGAVLNRFTILSLEKLETIVPNEIISDNILTSETSAPISVYIAGHALPNMESGMPSPIYAIKITTNNMVVTIIMPILNSVFNNTAYSIAIIGDW